MNTIQKFFLALLILYIYWVPSFSVEGQTVRTDYMETELVVETTSIKPGEPFWAGLRMKMDDHWHTYWRNPGDSGLPTEINWSLPDGFQVGEINWPYPQKIIMDMLASYAYEGETLLLVKITPPNDLEAGDSVEIKALASWLVCADICLPGEADYQITLPVTSHTPEASEKWSELFRKTREKLPVFVPEWKVETTISNSMVLLHATPPDWYRDDLGNVEFFPYNGFLIDHVSPQKMERTKTGYLLTMKQSEFFSEKPKYITGVLVSREGWRGASSEQTLAVNAGYVDELPAVLAASVIPNSSDLVSGLWQALVFALIGGLILNLMPCVFPVLSIKILGFIDQAGENPEKTRRHGLYFTAGVLVSFLVLASILIGLRTGGEQLGWGFQLQSPTFIVIISVIIFMFGLSLFGVFEIGTTLVGLGGKMDSRTGFGGSFLSGVLATVVATPCTAPFMGVALGYALTQSTVQALMIFGFMGLGMALPYLTISSVPSLLKYVPKPGAWMESFKQFMGFLMMVTVVWLVWVLNLQTGPNLVAIVMVLLVIIGIASWILGRWGSITAPNRSRVIARASAAVITLVSMTIVLTEVPASSSSEGKTIPSEKNIDVTWRPFSQKLVDNLRDLGKPVFVNFTAAWCLSCQVNKRVALNDSRVIEQFEKLDVVLVQADWTSRNSEITRALANFGRNSVPLYVLYTGVPGADPEILPELITPNLVLDALEKVEAGSSTSR